MTIRESLNDSLRRIDRYIRAREHIMRALDEISAAEDYRDNKISDGGGLKVEPDNLTPKESELFRLLGEGLEPRTIAERLKKSLKTIEAQRDTLRKKLGYATARELTDKAIETFGRGGIK